MIKKWTLKEEKTLIDNYSTKTINELADMLNGRDADSINSKIKRLKKERRIKEQKEQCAIDRAYKQRNTVDKDTS